MKSLTCRYLKNVAAVSNLASAAGWLLNSQLPSANAARIKVQQSWSWGEKSEQRRRLAVGCAECE